MNKKFNYTHQYLSRTETKTISLKGMLNNKKRNSLVILYILVLVLNSIILTLIFIEKGTIITFIKYDVLIVGILITFLNSLFVRKRWKEHIFIAGITMLCEYVILGVPGYLIPKIMPFDNIYAYTSFIMMYGLMILICYFPLKLMLNKTIAPYLQIDKNKYWNILWIIPSIICIALYIQHPYDENIENGFEFLSRILMGIAMIIVCFSVVSDKKSLLEKQILLEQISNSKIYYSNLQAKIEESRKIKHDLKHLLLGITQYIETDDKRRLEEFCYDIKQNQLFSDNTPYTGNVAVDGLLHSYLCKAAVSNIDFKYTGKLNIIGISDMDLCVILGNALDNAFTGCMTIPENRKVTLVTQIEQETLFINIKNNFDGIIDKKDNVILSRKRENSEGIGLKSIKSICDKYQGTMEIKWENDTFIILIILKIDKNYNKV